MRLLATTLCIAAMLLPAHAEEPTLNDLPRVLKTVRGCGMVSCDADVWASVHESGEITFYLTRGRVKVNGSGRTISHALADLARTLNSVRADAKGVLDAMAPFLPTQ